MSYEAKDIQVLEGLDAVRVRPGMYIGTTGSKGLHHILWEIIDNGIDELANKYGDRIDIEIYEDNSISVFDNGRGIPVDIHPKLKVSALQVVFTQLHAGAKFESEKYGFSGGLHGVGASVTNALSRWLSVDVYKGGMVYTLDFHSPEVGGKILSGVPKDELRCVKGKVGASGTKVRFLPDDRVFGREKVIYEVVAKRIRELSFLNGGITITLTDHREKNEDGEARYVKYRFEGGLSDFALYLNEGKDTLYDKPLYIEKATSEFDLKLAVQNTSGYAESVFSYVNNIPTTEGGTHETGFKSAYTKVLNDFARQNGYLNDKQQNYLGEDFRQGITAVLAIKMRNVQFEGQTKTKLGNPEARTIVEGLVVEALSEYLKKCPSKTLDAIYAKASSACKERLAVLNAKSMSRKLNSLSPTALIGKLSSCTGRKSEDNELYLVEGDSAGGSAKQGRDRRFQAILPLRGKPLNAEKKSVEQILANEEILSIINALGAGFAGDFNPENLKYHKLIILADADQDGAHIRAILLTFFFRYMKDLLLGGNVYIGMPPLYKIENRGKIQYAYDDDQLREILDSVEGRSYKLQRYKGLGEMNPEQLWDTTMNPATRTLMRVTIEDAADAEKMISVLMGDDIDARKKYINENANFNKADNYEEIGG